MTANFNIADGDPHFWLSPGIWCKNSAGTPVGWTATDAAPPGAFENPRYQLATNYVWVNVAQFGNVDGDQDAYLHLFAGKSGSHYLADQITQPTNQFTPAAGWTLAQWEAEMDLGKVVRVRWFDGLSSHDTCHISDVVQRPGPGNSKWYQFKWDTDCVPPDSDTALWHVCLFAYVDDNKSSGTDYSVSGNASFGQMNCIVDPVSKRAGIRRRVVLGNRGSGNRQMGVHLATEGEAAQGAEITLRFLEPSQAHRRVCLPDSAVPTPEIPLAVTRVRPMEGQGHAVLRDAPLAWGLQGDGSKLRVIAQNAGFRLPVDAGEMIQMEVFVKPGPRGKALKVHLLEFTAEGMVPGGVTLDLKVG